METRDHLFFTCSYSEEVWRKVIRNILGSGYSNEWNQLLLVLVAILQDKTLTFILRYCFQATVYTLWHERNRRRVGELSKAPPVLAALLDKLVRDRITSIKGRLAKRPEAAMSLWFASRLFCKSLYSSLFISTQTMH